MGDMVDAESFSFMEKTMQDAIEEGEAWWNEGLEEEVVENEDFDEGLEEELEDLEAYDSEKLQQEVEILEGEEEEEEEEELEEMEPCCEDASTDHEVARLVPEKSQTLAVARLRSRRPQLVPADGAKVGEKRKGTSSSLGAVQLRYLPPHEKRRRMELARWKEIKAAWHRKLQEEEALGPRSEPLRFEATLENHGSCCFNLLQKDECIEVSADGLRAQCDPSSSGPSTPASGGIKGLPLVAGGRYQYEVELRCACSLMVGWSPALVLPSVVGSSGRSAARRMLGYSSDGELVGEGCLLDVPGFGRPGDVVGALLDWLDSDSCGPRLSFMLNGRHLGMAFDLLAEGSSTPPLQPHICQGQGRPFSVLLRGASQEAPLRYPMPGYRPLGHVAERHFSPFSKAVEVATALTGKALRQQKPPPAAARRLIHSSLGLALPLPHLAQERSLGQKPRTVTQAKPVDKLSLRSLARERPRLTSAEHAS
eukprot:g17609.t1